jgi:site-specific DNA recombinase
MSERAALYPRVSTDLQRDNYSIPSQISECLKYAASKGYTIVGDKFVSLETGRDTLNRDGTVAAFVDDFTSRELNRPGLDAALDYLERVGFDVLIVHALDRLARDAYIRQTLERDFLSRGARVEYVLGAYEETPEGEVRKDLDATFGKWENAKRTERCNRGKRRKAETGKFVGGRSPYGYMGNPHVPGGLAINELEAEVVKRIFHMYVHQKLSIRQIARVLTLDNIVPQMGGKAWGKSSVVRILSNTTYAGHCYYNKYMRKGKKLILRNKNEWMRITVTPIIEQWVFDEAQILLEENRNSKRSQPTRFYQLSGMVFCNDCGRPYITQAKRAGVNRLVNDALAYRHRTKEGHCINKMVSARKLEPIVWDEVAKVLLDPERLYKGYQESLEQQAASQAKQKAYLETLRERLVNLERQRNNLTALYIDPEIKMTKYEYMEQKERIDVEVKGTVADIELIEAELVSVPTPSELETIEQFAENVRGRLQRNGDMSPADKRHILELLHVKVLISIDGKVRVTGWFGQDESELSTCLTSQSY